MVKTLTAIIGTAFGLVVGIGIGYNTPKDTSSEANSTSKQYAQTANQDKIPYEQIKPIDTKEAEQSPLVQKQSTKNLMNK